MAGDLAAGHRDQPLVELAAAVLGQRVARVEPAAGRWAGRVGHVAGQVDRQHAGPVGARDRRHQRLRVRVPRIGPHRLGVADLHDPAQIHDRDPVGDLADDRQVVGDQDQAEVGVVGQLAKQVGDLRLGRGVQGADRLVSDQAGRLRRQRPGDGDPLPPARPVGRERYEWFLREVACVPLTVAEIAGIGRREYERAVWLELLHATRNRGLPEPVLPADAASQVCAHARGEEEVRRFYAGRGLLSQPEWLRHYLTRPMPAYLEPLRFLGVTDDLTGPGRLTEDGVSYVPAPGPELPYFYAANARDPRAGILHEGVHYQQLALAWRHPRPVRRHYYDSGANEGIAFYNEEMMLVSGLLDDAPHTRTAICNFMRLRALRVTVDVGLATGTLSIPAAAGDLASRVPVDDATAREEAAFFAETPGQALTYQIGKTQLIALVADAVRRRGAGLDLQRLHDQVWVNGNVPIALLRWELLGLTDELAALDVDAG